MRYRPLILTGIAISIFFIGFAIVMSRNHFGRKVAHGIVTKTERINHSQFVDVKYEINGQEYVLHTQISDKSYKPEGSRVFVRYMITNPHDAGLFPYSQLWMEGVVVWAIGTAAGAYVVGATIHDLRKESRQQ